MENSRHKQIEYFKAPISSEDIFQNRQIILFLDFDGTLAAIVDHYKSATILKESKVLLRDLAKLPTCLVAVVSGRELSDVKKRVGLKRITYAGNHGLEIQGPGVKYNFFVKISDRILLKPIKHDLIANIGQIKGALIEDKGLTLTVHYRLVKRCDLFLFKKKLLECLKPYSRSNDVSIGEGKKVFEIKSKVNWNKGKAILWLIDHFQRRSLNKKIFPVFVGDDLTDETAFKALRRKGLCIRVGQNETSAAPYFVKDIKQVTRFLRTILNSQLPTKKSLL